MHDWVAMGFFGTSASAKVVVNDVAVRQIVEDGPDLWLEQLTHAIDRVAVPKA